MKDNKARKRTAGRALKKDMKPCACLASEAREPRNHQKQRRKKMKGGSRTRRKEIPNLSSGNLLAAGESLAVIFLWQRSEQFGGTEKRGGGWWFPQAVIGNIYLAIDEAPMGNRAVAGKLGGEGTREMALGFALSPARPRRPGF